MEFTQEIADLICEQIADGKSLRSICLHDGMPSKTSVFRWLDDERYVAFRDQYTRAREFQADSFVDEIQDISDEVVDPEQIARNRLRVDSRKWMAGKLRPKVYGDKVEHEHKGSVSIIASAVDEAL